MGLNPFEGARGYLKVFRRHLGRRLYLVFVLALLAALTEGLGISLLLPLLAAADVGLGAETSIPPLLVRLTDTLGIDESLVGILLLISGVFTFKGLIAFGYGAYNGLLQAQLMRELKGGMFRACSEMSYRYYSERSTGHFVNLINAQISAFYQCFAAYTNFIINVIKSLTYLCVAMLLAWRFGLMALGAGVVLLTSFRYLNVQVKGLSRKTSGEMSTLNKYLVQALQAYKYLASTGQMRRMGDGVEASVHRATSYQARTHVWQAFTGSITEPISVFLIVVIVIVQVAVLEQPLAPILVAILLFHRGMNSLMSVQSQWQTTMAHVGSLEMVEQEIAQLRQNREAGGESSIGPMAVGIAFRDVCFAYDAQVGNVIDGVSFLVPAKQTIALVGESGAGKSTIVDLMTLLLKPNAGSISIDGVDARDVELRSWRSQIGYVSQDTVVFDDTIAANIAMEDLDPAQDQAKLEQVRSAARQARLDEFIESLPEGYQTAVGDRGIRLSGGQRQRLFIARELYRQPRLLILDEATSALDSESERGVQQSIEALHGAMTVVIIAHRLATIREADQVLVFSQGRIVEQGTYTELTAQAGSRFSRMVELQAL